MLDIKEYCQVKADELAMEEYGVDFYDLTDNQQTTVYNKAIEYYKDYMADQIDYRLDYLRDLPKYVHHS